MGTLIMPANRSQSYAVAKAASGLTVANGGSANITFQSLSYASNFDLSSGYLRYIGEHPGMVQLSAQVGFASWSATNTRLILLFTKNGGTFYGEQIDVDFASGAEPTIAMPSIILPVQKNDLFAILIGYQGSGATRTIQAAATYLFANVL